LAIACSSPFYRKRNMVNLNDIIFFLKTIMYLLPGGYGHYRDVRRYKDDTYVHERDKHPVRFKHTSDSGWKQQQTALGLRYRDYENYEEYKQHQAQKTCEIMKIGGGFTNSVIVRQRLTFWRRFHRLTIPKDSVILCAGARFGTEVEVLHDLGYQNAYGIDLEPGPNNKYVKKGDFMNIDCEDSSIDMIYSNAIDHAFDLEAFFTEHSRVIKDFGLIIYDIPNHHSGAFEAVEWNSDNTIFMLMLKHFKQVESVRINGTWKTVMLRGKKT